MKTGKILVQKVNIEEADLSLVLDFYDKTKEALPINIETVLIPHTWDFQLVDDNVIYIKIDIAIDVETTQSFINKIKEALGESYTITVNVCEAEVIHERF